MNWAARAALCGCLLLPGAAAQKHTSGSKTSPVSAFKLIAFKVTGTARYSDKEILVASGLQLAQRSSDGDFKEAVRRLGNSGMFSNAAYSYSTSSAGTKLELQVTDVESSKLVPAHFENFVWFTDDQLHATVQKSAPLFKDLLPMGGNLSEHVSEALQALLSEKQLPGRVNFLREANGPEGAMSAINYRVEEVSIRIRAVEFPGASPQQGGLLEKVASKSHFHVALLYNEPEDEDQQSTDDAIAGLDKAYNSYIGPEAKYHDAYFTYQGHPVIFIFPKQGHVDWNHVRDRCSAWAATPLFIYKDEPPAQYAADFAGSYAWVQPGAGEWSPDGSNWGEKYLDNFYRTMRNKHPDKIAIGGVWPGFDDSGAKWGLNRHMQRACGKTFDETLHMYDRYYDSTTTLPFLLIETWNDYEEGTAIERGISGPGCAPDQKLDPNPSAAH